MNDADGELVTRAQAGDRQAFESLVRQTSRLVFARLYLDTGDPHRAEDLVQETYLHAFRSLHQVTDPSGFRPWLLKVAHRVMLDTVRAEGRQKRATSRTGELDVSLIAGNGLSPEEVVHREESRRAVLAALRELPDEYRMPLSLRYLAGSDYETIGNQLGLTNGSLRGLLQRGLKLLRDKLPTDFA